MMSILILALALSPVTTAQDTVVSARGVDRLVLSDFGGELRVEGWDREEISIDHRGGREFSYRLRQRGGSLELIVEDPKARGRDPELVIRIPRRMGMEVSGGAFSADVSRVDGSLDLSNRDGDLTVAELTGEVRLSSLEGDIRGTRLSGTVEVRGGEDEVVLRDCTGRLTIQTVNGDITLTGMEAERVVLRSTDGDVEFNGGLMEGGEYEFRTHSGDIQLQLAAPVNLSATVLTYDGEFESALPMRARSFESGKKLEFTVGEAGARLTVETFDGDVRIEEIGRSAEPVVDGRL